MNNKRIIFFILIIFIVGMLCGGVSASHTYHKGKYTFKVTDKQYDRIQYVKKHKHDENLKKDASFKIKLKKKVTVKIPVYKNKKVKKTKWQYKYIKTYHYNQNNYDYRTYSIPLKYYKSPWKYDGGYHTTYDGFAIFKKKVKYYDTVKVKSGYKKVKMNVYAIVSTYAGGHYDEDSDSFVYDYYPQVQFIGIKKGYATQYLTGHYRL